MNKPYEFKCIKCDTLINVVDLEMWDLLEETDEDGKYIDCPSCCSQIKLLVRCEYHFRCEEEDE